jgi:hypothetical protein
MFFTAMALAPRFELTAAPAKGHAPLRKTLLVSNDMPGRGARFSMFMQPVRAKEDIRALVEISPF